MIKQMTKVERLQWEHQKLAHARSDLKMVRSSFQDREMKTTQEYDDISRLINHTEDLMWKVESEVRFEKRIAG